VSRQRESLSMGCGGRCRRVLRLRHEEDRRKKHQTPNTKHQINTRHQSPNSSPRCDTFGRFGAWNLGLLWCLQLGVWCFSLFSPRSHQWWRRRFRPSPYRLIAQHQIRCLDTPLAFCLRDQQRVQSAGGQKRSFDVPWWFAR